LKHFTSSGIHADIVCHESAVHQSTRKVDHRNCDTGSAARSIVHHHQTHRAANPFDSSRMVGPGTPVSEGFDTPHVLSNMRGRDRNRLHARTTLRSSE